MKAFINKTKNGLFIMIADSKWWIISNSQQHSADVVNIRLLLHGLDH